MKLAAAEWTAVLLAVGVGLAWTAGVWSDPTGRTLATHFTDGHLAGAAVAAEGLWSGELFQLRTSMAGWPDGVMFRPLLWPVMILAGLLGPVLALNLTWALAPALNAVGGILLGRALSLSPWGRGALGMLIAWCTWNRVTLGNGQLEQATLGAIAAVWAAGLWAEDGPWWRITVAPALLLATGLAAPNAGLAAALGLGILALTRILQSPGRLPRYAAVLGLCLASTLGIHGYHSENYTDTPNFFQPRLRPPEGHSPYRFGVPSGWHANATQQLDRADIVSLLVPAGPDAYTASPVQHVPFLGGTLMLGALAGVVRDRGRCWPLLVLGIAMAVLSMGSETVLLGQRFLMPYGLITTIAPSAASSGSAYRLAMAAIVALAAAAAVGLDRHRWALPGLVVLAWVETTLLPGNPLPHPTRPITDHPELAVLAGQEGPVLDLPLPIRGSCDAQTAHYFNAFLDHKRPLLHTLAAGPNYLDRSGTIRQLNYLFRSSACPRLLPDILDELGATAVVLHVEEPCVPGREVYQCLEDALGPPQTATDIFFWTR